MIKTNILSINFILFFIIIITGSIIFKNVGQKFNWSHDYPSAHHSTNAISHIKYGLSITKGALVRNNNPTLPENLLISNHHPPSLPLIIAASYKIFGISESVSRGTMAFISLVNVILIYIAASLFIDRKTGIISSLIYSFLPLQLWYATKINHEPLVVMFVLATFIAYYYWNNKPSVLRLFFLVVMYSLGTTTGWAAYYTGGIIPAFHLSSKLLVNKALSKNDLYILVLPFCGIAMFGLFLLHLYLVDSSLLANLFHLAQERIGTIDSYNNPTFSNISLLVKTTERSVLFFTLPVISIAFFGVLYCITLISNKDLTGVQYKKSLFIISLWLFGMSHLIVFRNVSWVHSFLVYYLMPAIAVTTAYIFCDQFYHNKQKYIFGGIFLLLFLPISLYQTRQLTWTGKIPNIIPLSKKIEQNVPSDSIIFSAATNHPYLHPALPHYSHRDYIFEVETVQQLEQLLQEWPNSHPYFLMHEGPSVDHERTKALLSYLNSKNYPVKSFPGLSSILYDLSPS